MPSRVIRGEINSSVSLNRVSIGAELTFDRLITAVDDFGRFDARREMLKAALFPVRSDAPPELVMEWIRELADEGCVRLYEVEGRSFLCLPGWEKHRGNQRRRKESIYPDPPRESSNASKPMPRKSGNPPEVTAGVGVGFGLGDGGGGGVNHVAASPPPAPPESPQKPQGITSQSPQKTKRATQCPEDLTPEQWGQVHAWRDRKHPEFDDWILKSEWEKHAAHFGALGKPRPDWVKSFYSWLLRSKDFSKSKGGTDPPRPTPPVRKREPRPPAWTAEELADAKADGDARRKKGRARHAEASTDPPDAVETG